MILNANVMRIIIGFQVTRNQYVNATMSMKKLTLQVVEKHVNPRDVNPYVKFMKTERVNAMMPETGREKAVIANAKNDTP